MQTFYGCASITASQRSQFANKQCVPGPGTYDPTKQDQQRIPMWTLKSKLQYTSCFHNNDTQIPAPGNYDVPSSIVNVCLWKKVAKKQKGRNIKLNKEKDRNYGERNQSIIPLQIPSFVDQKSGFSFGYRSPLVVNQTSPGPKYHINQILEERRNKRVKNKLNGFGSGEKNNFQKQSEQSPGPGQYSPKHMYATSGNWSFSKSTRRDKMQSANPIGPGQYNLQLQQSARSFKFKGKYSPIKVDNFDASPGSYQIPDTKSKRSAVFREIINNEDRQNAYMETPSPFTYDIMNSTLKKGGFTLGKKVELHDQNRENPGPGSYQVEMKITDKVGGYMCRKIQQKRKASETQDNFYKYNPKNDSVTYKYPQYSFSQATNTAIPRSSDLGPGSYNIIIKSSGESYSLSKNARFKELVKQKSLGSLLTNKNSYSSVGCMPSYLKRNSNNKGKQSQPYRN